MSSQKDKKSEKVSREEEETKEDEGHKQGEKLIDENVLLKALLKKQEEELNKRDEIISKLKRKGEEDENRPGPSNAKLLLSFNEIANPKVKSSGDLAGTSTASSTFSSAIGVDTVLASPTLQEKKSESLADFDLIIVMPSPTPPTTDDSHSPPLDEADADQEGN